MGGLAWPIRTDRAPGRKANRPSLYGTAGGSCRTASWPARASEAREETKGVVLPAIARPSPRHGGTALAKGWLGRCGGRRESSDRANTCPPPRRTLEGASDPRPPGWME
eukprot:3785958-Prymnesium_polylepis.1